MKFKMIQVIGLLVTAFSSSTLSATLPVGGQNFSPENILVNPGFENGSYGWTASGGAIKAANATAKGAGSFGYDWDSNAAAQTLVSNLITIPPGYQGQNGVAYCSFKVPSGTATHTFTVDDGTNNVAVPATITTSTSFIRTAVNFIFPSSGSIRIKVASVASNEPEIYIDQCYLGGAGNISQVSQASFYGAVKWPYTTNCSWSRTSVQSFGSFAADSDCTTPTGSNVIGYASAPATKIPAITFASMKPGTYIIHATGEFAHNNAQRCVYAISDGTTLFQSGGMGTSSTATDMSSNNVVGYFTYTTAQANKTFEIQTTVSNVSGTCGIDNDAIGKDLNIWAEYFPTQTETAARSDQLPGSWSGYHNSSCPFTQASTTYADMSTANAGCALVERSNRNFGTVSIAGGTGTSAKPGITFTPPRLGRYLVIATMNVSETSSGHTAAFALTDGTANFAEQSILSYGNGFYNSLSVVGVYNATSAASTTIKIQSKVSASTFTIGNATGASSIEWQIISLDQSFPAPVLVGSVTSNTLGMERIERAQIANNGTAASITSQSGSWIASATRTAAGQVTLSVNSGIFSARPSCIFTTNIVSTFGYLTEAFGTVTSTSIPTRTITVGGVDSDQPFDVICMGPR